MLLQMTSIERRVLSKTNPRNSLTAIKRAARHPICGSADFQGDGEKRSDAIAEN
jgi:hypothetical protein